jgi:hypothetical protein
MSVPLNGPVMVGTIVEMKLFPGFNMKVLDTRKCDCGGPVKCYAYKVIDPEDKEDWLCELDCNVIE